MSGHERPPAEMITTVPVGAVAALVAVTQPKHVRVNPSRRPNAGDCDTLSGQRSASAWKITKLSGCAQFAHGNRCEELISNQSIGDCCGSQNTSGARRAPDPVRSFVPVGARRALHAQRRWRMGRHPDAFSLASDPLRQRHRPPSGTRRTSAVATTARTALTFAAFLAGGALFAAAVVLVLLFATVLGQL
jgi:hypothetical protein